MSLCSRIRCAALRLAALLLLLANGVRLFVFDLLGWEIWTNASVCFYFCAEARVVALSGLLTFEIFLAKYCYTLIRYRKRCVLLSTKLRFTVKRLATPSASDASSKFPLEQQSGLLNSDAASSSRPNSLGLLETPAQPASRRLTYDERV